MIYRIIREQEIEEASNLARYVFDTCLRNDVHDREMLSFVEDYLMAEHLRRKVQNNQLVMWGAWDKRGLCAVSGMQPEGHITMLYVVPYAQKHKIAKELLRTMRAYARSEWHLKRVSVNALLVWTSTYFARRGFYYTNESGERIAAPLQADSAASRYASYLPMAAKTIDEQRYPVRPTKDWVVTLVVLGFLALVFLVVIIFVICVYFPY